MYFLEPCINVHGSFFYFCTGMQDSAPYSITMTRYLAFLIR